MLSSMQASGFISESQFDEWSPAITSAVMSGTEGEDYAQIAAAIVDAFDQMTSEQERRENEAQKRHETEEDDSDLSGAVTVLQTVAESLSTLKADVTTATKEGCMAGVGAITVTGSVSTGNVVLNTGSLVGSLAPMLNVRLGTRNEIR